MSRVAIVGRLLISVRRRLVRHASARRLRVCVCGIATFSRRDLGMSRVPGGRAAVCRIAAAVRSRLVALVLSVVLHAQNRSRVFSRE